MDYFEADLEIPFLKVLSERKDGFTMSQIKNILIPRLNPSGSCAEPSKTRKGEIKLHQRIGNFTTLRERRVFVNGFATYNKETGIYKITNKGREFLRDNEEIYDSLISQGFTKKQREEEVEKDFKDLIIEEGTERQISSKQRKRSGKLRKLAMDNFMDSKGNIICEVCAFNFLKKYGEHGKGFIEIHHKEPIHEVSEKGRKTNVSDAIKKLSPVCSNCHRMIHRNKDKMLDIEELKKLIK